MASSVGQWFLEQYRKSREQAGKIAEVTWIKADDAGLALIDAVLSDFAALGWVASQRESLTAGTLSVTGDVPDAIKLAAEKAGISIGDLLGYLQKYGPQILAFLNWLFSQFGKPAGGTAGTLSLEGGGGLTVGDPVVNVNVIVKPTIMINVTGNENEQETETEVADAVRSALRGLIG